MYNLHKIYYQISGILLGSNWSETDISSSQCGSTRGSYKFVYKQADIQKGLRGGGGG